VVKFGVTPDNFVKGYWLTEEEMDRMLQLIDRIIRKVYPPVVTEVYDVEFREVDMTDSGISPTPSHDVGAFKNC